MKTVNIVTFKEKHGDWSYAFKTDKGFHKICLEVFQRREEQGWYWSDGNQDEDELREKAKSGDAKAAFLFLNWHMDYEYEYYELERNLKVYE